MAILPLNHLIFTPLNHTIMHSSLRFGLIGCGNIGCRHAEQMKRTGVITAVCDIFPERADRLAAAYNATAYYDVAQLLANTKNHLDVVAVCTPNGIHAANAIAAMKAGCHVLCEKPLAISTAEAQLMIETALSTRKKLFVVKQNRFNPPVAAVKKILEENRLGTIYSFQINCFWNRSAAYYENSWRGTKTADGGTLFTQFSHFIDLLYWFLGPVNSVQAITSNYHHAGVIEVEDTGMAILKMEGGASGTLHYTVNTFNKNMEGSFTLFGEKGTVKIGGQYLNELEFQSIDDYTIAELPAGNPANAYGFYTGSMSNHNKVYDELVKALQNNSNGMVEAADGLKTIEIIEMIYKAASGI